MKPRKLRLIAKVAGFPTVIAELKISNFAKEPELRDWTELVCPNCGKPTAHHQSWDCPTCKQSFSWWGKLLRVIKGTTQKVEMPKLTKEGETTVGLLYKLPLEEFAQKYVDATKGERGVEEVDAGSSFNLCKLLAASSKYAIIVKFNDTTEEVVALLKVSLSQRIILQEVIPKNLVQLKNTLKLNTSQLSKTDLQEGNTFVENFLPTATDKTLEVSDYRTMWLEQHIIAEPEQEQGRVKSLLEIMAAAKGSPQKVVAVVKPSRRKKK